MSRAGTGRPARAAATWCRSACGACSRASTASSASSGRAGWGPCSWRTISRWSAQSAFKQVVLLDPERQLDPNRVSPKAYSAFDVALRQVLLVRQLRVDSSSFVGGRGAVSIRFTVTQPARVVTRAIGGSGCGSFLGDSGALIGQVNLSWPARMPNGDPVPAGSYTVVVDARLGQNTFSASQPVRVSHGTVDTLPFLMSLPGYQYLPETEVPPQSWRPLGLAFLYTGGALVGTVGLESSTLGSSS